MLEAKINVEVKVYGASTGIVEVEKSNKDILCNTIAKKFFNCYLNSKRLVNVDKGNSLNRQIKATTAAKVAQNQ